MSACMSDVDLATLHKCRLDQRIKYQLSAGWVNRRGIPSSSKSKSTIRNLSQPPKVCVNANDDTNQPHVIAQCQCDCEEKLNDHVACQRSLVTPTNTIVTAATVGNQAEGIKSADDMIADNRKVEANRENCKKHAYLTRRRSGTWP